MTQAIRVSHEKVFEEFTFKILNMKKALSNFFLKICQHVSESGAVEKVPIGKDSTPLASKTVVTPGFSGSLHHKPLTSHDMAENVTIKEIVKCIYVNVLFKREWVKNLFYQQPIATCWIASIIVCINR